MAALAPLQIQDLNLLITEEFKIELGNIVSSAPLWYRDLTAVMSGTQSEYRTLIEVNNYDIEFTADLQRPPTYTDPYLREFKSGVERWSPQGVRIHNSQLGDEYIIRDVRARVAAMASTAAWAPQRRWIDMLVNGDTDPIWTTYDGQQLFSNTHTVGVGASFDNLFALPLTGPNLVEVIRNMLQAPIGMDGEPLPFMPGLKIYLITPPGALERTAKLILKNEYLYEANIFSTNVDAQLANPIVEPLLTDLNDWYVVATFGKMRPVAHYRQTDVLGNSVLVTPKPDDELVKNQGLLTWALRDYAVLVPERFEFMAKSVQ